MNPVIFQFGRTGIVEQEIGEVRRRMTCDAVADAPGRQFAGARRKRLRFPKEDLQALKLRRAELKELIVKLKPPVIRAGITRDEGRAIRAG